MISRTLMQKAQCSSSDKKDCLSFLEKILKYAVLAVKEGIPALKPLYEAETEPYLKEGIGLLLEGLNIDALRERLAIDESLEQSVGKDLLKKILVLESISCIFYDCDVETIRKNVAPWFGSDFQQELNVFFETVRKQEKF